jgi:hypothetical protein
LAEIRRSEKTFNGDFGAIKKDSQDAKLRFMAEKITTVLKDSHPSHSVYATVSKKNKSVTYLKLLQPHKFFGLFLILIYTPWHLRFVNF